MSKGDTIRPRAVPKVEWDANYERIFAPTPAPSRPPAPHQCPDCGGEAYSIVGERDVCLDCGRGAPR
jgi:hypothetical protein